MQILKFEVDLDPVPHVGLLDGGRVLSLGRGEGLLTEILHAPQPAETVRGRIGKGKSAYAADAIRVLPPIDGQEVWGAGVTYERSKIAREQESDRAATFYDLVYKAKRPELFFKATAHRVAGPEKPIRVRADSRWSVPEPELALVLNPALEIVGFTVGNDVSARDIEGENPLYLPQAKVYDGCCALGPVITLAEAMPPRPSIGIRLEIVRASKTVYSGETGIARMARTFEELIGWLGRDSRFPDGVILLTGTGLVPPDDFALAGGDVVRITIDGIGTLTNPVVQGGRAES